MASVSVPEIASNRSLNFFKPPTFSDETKEFIEANGTAKGFYCQGNRFDVLKGDRGCGLFGLLFGHCCYCLDQGWDKRCD